MLGGQVSKGTNHGLFSSSVQALHAASRGYLHFRWFELQDNPLRISTPTIYDCPGSERLNGLLSNAQHVNGNASPEPTHRTLSPYRNPRDSLRIAAAWPGFLSGPDFKLFCHFACKHTRTCQGHRQALPIEYGFHLSPVQPRQTPCVELQVTSNSDHHEISLGSHLPSGCSLLPLAPCLPSCPFIPYHPSHQTPPGKACPLPWPPRLLESQQTGVGTT